MAAFTYQPNSTTRHVGTGSADTLSIPTASALASGKNFVANFNASDVITLSGYDAQMHGPVVLAPPFLLVGPSQVPVIFFEDNDSTAAQISTSA